MLGFDQLSGKGIDNIVSLELSSWEMSYNAKHLSNKSKYGHNSVVQNLETKR